MIELLGNVAIGLETAVTPVNLIYCFVGVFVGMLVGVLPGIGPLTAISMLLPLTYHFDPTTALIMLGGIWYGTAYGGSTAAILLNIPGTTSSAVACLDGYPMAQQGRGGVALLMTTVASFIGASIAIVILMGFAPVIARYALQFGSADYFALMVLGLVAASAISDGSAAKGLGMVVLGIVLGTFGMDIYSGQTRFSFSFLELANGISLVGLAMGLFGVAEVVSSVGSSERKPIDRSSVTFRAMKPTPDDLKRSWLPILRGTGLGSFFGTLPGTGPSIASFMSYALEKRIAREPQRFGHGAIEGVVAPEAANNAADQTAFIPTLALGIPGSATMALMLGALTINGIAPGPSLMTAQPGLFWGLIMSFWIGNLMLLILNIPMIGIWVGQPEALTQIHEQIDDLRLDRDIERGDSFITHHELGIDCQSASNANALALSAGKLMRETGLGARVQSRLSKNIVDMGIELGIWHHLMKVGGFAHGLAHPEARIQRIQRVLEDHLHLERYMPRPLATGFGDIFAAVENASTGGVVYARDDPPQGGFSTAGFAHQTDHFTLADLERN
eukprot:jgi/Tetstr1/450312/TSEL_037348.t1